MAADNHFESNDKRTLLRNGGRDVEIYSENDDRRMSQLAQSTELRNGEITPYAAGPTEFNSELPNQLTQLPDGREPRRWITKTEWTDSIREDHLRNRPPSVVSIFRVPKLLKDIKREAYVPQRVSLGPYHHGSRDLPPMNYHKGRALRRMMTGFNTNRNLVIESNNMDFANRAMEEILKVEKEIRDSYEENIDCNGETLARMLALDGCFLLQVLRTLCREKLSTRDEAENCYDPIFGEKKLLYAANDVQNDILKLENQMPLIILRKLLELELHSAVEGEKQLNVLMKFISAKFNPFHNKNRDKAEYWSWLQQAEQEVHHVLGFLHTVIASPQSPRQGNSGISIDCCSQCIRMRRDKSKAGGARVGEGECSFSIYCCGKQCIMKIYDNNKAGNDYISRIPHAVELRNVGIKFKRSDGGIKDIKFDENSATIFLPSISIDDRTETVFRNLIAYEMCNPSKINYVSCYVTLMDGLIDSEEDVALLKRMGIMSNWLGNDKEAADLFNGLCKEVVLGWNNQFKELKQNVRAHYRNKLKVQFAELARDHFSSPWKALALMGAIVVLVLTALQTIYTMK